MTRVIVDDGIFATLEYWTWQDVEGWEPEPMFCIVTDAPAAVEAALAAAARFKMIDGDGVELTHEQSIGSSTPIYTDVDKISAGLRIYVDSKGAMPRAQGEKMIAALVEELDSRGVEARITLAPDRMEDGEPLE